MVTVRLMTLIFNLTIPRSSPLMNFQVRELPEGPDRLELQQDLERVLYHDQESSERFFTECKELTVEEGADLEFVRVLPSYLDRDRPAWRKSFTFTAVAY